MKKKESLERSNSLRADIIRRFLRNKTAFAALIVLLLFILMAIFADVIVPYEKATEQHVMDRFTAPGATYIFGSDAFGRDIFARVIHGSRLTLAIGVVTTLFSTILSCAFGSVAGYFGGKVDNIIMRLMDILICIPGILLAMCIVATLGTSTKNLIIALSISTTPGFTRIVRSVVLNVKDSDFIEAAKACGSSNVRIIMSHILPNAIGPIIVQMTINISTLILAAAGLSYLGLGTQPPTPEWGLMLSEAKAEMSKLPYLTIIPGIALVMAALAFNLTGDGLRDALDPRLKD